MNQMNPEELLKEFKQSSLRYARRTGLLNLARGDSPERSFSDGLIGAEEPPGRQILYPTNNNNYHRFPFSGHSAFCVITPSTPGSYSGSLHNENNNYTLGGVTPSSLGNHPMTYGHVEQHNASTMQTPIRVDHGTPASDRRRTDPGDDAQSSQLVNKQRNQSTGDNYIPGQGPPVDTYPPGNVTFDKLIDAFKKYGRDNANDSSNNNQENGSSITTSPVSPVQPFQRTLLPDALKIYPSALRREVPSIDLLSPVPLLSQPPKKQVNAVKRKESKNLTPSGTGGNPPPYQPTIASLSEKDIPNADEKEALENSRKEIDRKLYALHLLQVIPCVFLVGGFGRITGTSVNFFADTDSFFDTPVAAVVAILTTSFILVDVLFYQNLNNRDKWKINDEYEKCNKAINNEAESTEGLSKEAAKAILEETKRNARDALSTQHSQTIIKIMNEDIFIQQLLIQADIHKNDLIRQYQASLGKNAKHIIDLLEESSLNITRKNYGRLHPTSSTLTEGIEYVQSIKFPLRLASVMLLCHAIAVVQRDAVLSSNEVYIMIGTCCSFVWGLALIASYLEFEKEKYFDKRDEMKRKHQTKHHDVILSTLILSIQRKIHNPDSLITKAHEAQGGENKRSQLRDHSWLQNPLNWGFSHAIFLKMFPSMLILGSLGRRPMTFYTFLTFSEESDKANPNLFTSPYNTPAEDVEIVMSLVLVATVADLTYLFFSLKEEKWKLDRQEDEERTRAECEGHKPKDGMSKQLTSEEQLLCTELAASKNNTNSDPQLYEDKYPGWAFLGALFEISQFGKCMFRGLSLGFTMPRLFNKTDSLTLGDLDGMYVGMIAGAIIGLICGVGISVCNNVREKRLGHTEKGLGELFNDWREAQKGKWLKNWATDFNLWLWNKDPIIRVNPHRMKKEKEVKKASCLPLLFFYDQPLIQHVPQIQQITQPQHHSQSNHNGCSIN